MQANASSTVVTSREQAQAIIDKYSVFVFDIDGVVYLHEKPIPHAAETLLWLQNTLKKRLFFVTNNATRLRGAILSKFTKILGIPHDTFSEKQFCTAASLVADYLHQVDTKKAYVIGEGVFTQELALRGVPFVDGTSEHEHCKVDEKQFHQMFVSPPPEIQAFDAVIVGYDKSFNMYKCLYAACILQTNGEKCKSFIAGNREQTARVGVNTLLPHAIVMVSAVEAALDNGRKAQVLCKPSAAIIDMILKQLENDDEEQQHFKYSKSDIVMIGDSLDADIALAENASIDSILVLSGKTTTVEASVAQQAKANSSLNNNTLHVMSHIGLLYELLHKS